MVNDARTEVPPKIRKAVIPAAGFGTRLFPASHAVKKELFPIVDRDGRAKPVILAIIEEALAAGVEEICLVVQPDDQPLFAEFFRPPGQANVDKLGADSREYLDGLSEIGARVSYAFQETQDGFGHAVFCAREQVGDESFLLMLGDHLCVSNTGVSCAAQLMQVYEKAGGSVVGLKVTPGAEVHRYGCAGGSWSGDDKILAISEFVEKPSIEVARQRLVVDGVEPGHFLTIFGQYILGPQIFEYLEHNIANNVRERGEFQLTSCLDRLRAEHGCAGFVVDGTRYDVGVPEAYREAVTEFGRR